MKDEIKRADRGLGQRMYVLREEVERDQEKNGDRTGHRLMKLRREGVYSTYDGGRRKMNFRTWDTQGEGTMLKINEKTERWSRRGER